MFIIPKAGYDSMTLLSPVCFSNASNYSCFKFITAICKLCLEAMNLMSLCLSFGFYILHVTSSMMLQSLRSDSRKSCLGMCTQLSYILSFMDSHVSLYSVKWLLWLWMEVVVIYRYKHKYLEEKWYYVNFVNQLKFKLPLSACDLLVFEWLGLQNEFPLVEETLYLITGYP